MFYLRVKLRFYGLDEQSFFYFTFKIISGACQDIGIGGICAVSWVVSEVLSNCRYVCFRCLSMLGHSGLNILMRPILSVVGAYNHGLATYLGKLFSGLRDSKNICKDSFS